MPSPLSIEPLHFFELEQRFGRDNASSILRMLEQFEGIHKDQVAHLTPEQRFENVVRAMTDNMLYQTRH